MQTTSILLGTRKGTFIVRRSEDRWVPQLSGHAGAGSNFVARDPNTGTLWAALGHGHWGAKLSRSTDDGATWEDAAQIKYPEGARYIAPPDPTIEDDTRVRYLDATVLKLWILAFGGDGRIYVGTIPGGLFVSRDGGESFELNLPLWNHESRGGDLFAGDGSGRTAWFGTPASEGGEFAPGIHSIVVDPRRPERILVAISTGRIGDVLLDDYHRPKTFFTDFVQTGCPNAISFAQKVDGHFGKRGGCLFYEVGCRGPMTRASCNRILWNRHSSKTRANHPCLGCTEPGFPHHDLVKGSVFKTMKYLGFLPKDVPVGTNKLAYYSRAGFEKVMGAFENLTGVNKEHFETSK